MKMFSGFPSGRHALLIAALLLPEAFPTRAADANYYFVAKGMEYRQTSNAPPTPKGNPARFSAQVGLSATNAVTNATVQVLPSGPITNLVLGIGGTAGVSNTFRFQAKFASQSALDTTYPNGNYQIVIGAVHDGTKTLPLTLTGNTYPASAPYLTNPFDPNYSAIDVTNPAAPFTLAWAVFTGGTAGNFIQVTLADSLGNPMLQTPNPGQAGALNGTATSLVIPANTFLTGAQVFGVLVFAKIVQSNSTNYSGVPGFAAYYTETDFGLVTFSQDCLAYNIAKQQNLTQTNSGPPVLVPNNPFRFVANVLGTASNSITAAQVQPPPPAALDILTPDPTDTLFTFVQRFVTQSALDAAFLGGNYSLQISALHDGNKVFSLALPADAFPVAPHISNWAAAQNVDPTLDFNLTWDPFTGAGALDFIVLSVNDSLGNNLVAVSLPYSVTNYLFPAATLPANETNSIVLQFRHVITEDTTTYPGATGMVRFNSLMNSSLITAATGVAPSLAMVTTNGLKPFRLQLTGQAGRLTPLMPPPT